MPRLGQTQPRVTVILNDGSKVQRVVNSQAKADNGTLSGTIRVGTDRVTVSRNGRSKVWKETHRETVNSRSVTADCYEY